MLPFLDSAGKLPIALHKSDTERGFGSLAAKIKQLDDTAVEQQMNAVLSHPKGKALIASIFGHSPFLSRLLIQHPAFFADICTRGADICFGEITDFLKNYNAATAVDLMKTLRLAKAKTALLIATADIAGVWPLEQVTKAVSEIAELCVQAALGFLLRQSAHKGEITLADTARPEKNCGLFVIAMGKLGAYELNYSSDIDLIVFFDKDRVPYTGQQNIQQCFSKLTQELVKLLQERTADGYVFRIDLRLRPDPASTPVAMSVAGAITYYETVGQNWERAALIKARIIAGDREAGQSFLKQIAPFIWRKHLDFAAIADIQSIKRQMDAKTGETINLPGHNIKTGIGGIREIEFFVQIHQLIWGGRIPATRVLDTCSGLEVLAASKLISAELAQKLTDSYRFLRTIEHRLQMVDDQQTHSIPVAAEARAQLAAFAGFASVQAFEETLLAHLNFVHENFAQVFRGNSSLSGDGGKLSFTGVENDPQTVETIRKMGYQNPASVSEIIQGWHRGTRRATRTKRARELITELTPTLLKALASTTQPDQAFIHFDEFLTKLPAGVQLFSLFHVNPHLLDLIATIMGSAPAMAESLSKNSNLLDTVLTNDFFRELPDKTSLSTELSGQLAHARDFEDEMDIIRRFKNEKQFQAGIHLIRHKVSTIEASRYLSDIAETCVQTLLVRVEGEFIKKNAGFPTDCLSVIAMGRLGARELTFGSDIDLVFVYDTSSQSLDLHQNHNLFNKLSQRFITALTSLTREGRLYEVDTRLRPSGGDGSLAVSSHAFDKYFRESAWTFEFMALTRARVITGNDALRKNLDEIIVRHITQMRYPAKLANDIIDLRGKIAREFGSDNPWNLKYARGGLMDLDFLAQYFVLLHGHTHKDIISPSSRHVFEVMGEHKLIEGHVAAELMEAHRFLNSLFSLLRLCGGGVIDEATAPQGLKHFIVSSLQLGTFAEVKAALLATLARVNARFEAIVNPSHHG